jgi:uncharacterized OB-fold protein
MTDGAAMPRVPLKQGLLSTIEADEEPRLVGARCGTCRQLRFPASRWCPYCSGATSETIMLSPRGTLYAYTAVEKPPPGYHGRVPYGFGVVELPEGIRLISRLTESRIEALSFGMGVRLVLEELFVNEAGDCVIGWAFAPEHSP